MPLCRSLRLRHISIFITKLLCLCGISIGQTVGTASGRADIQLMSPISPMLAEACKSVERAILKCPDGMYSEIKYDGERIQLHKSGDQFRWVYVGTIERCAAEG